MARFWEWDFAKWAIETFLIAAAALLTFCLIFGVPRWRHSGFDYEVSIDNIKTSIDKLFSEKGAKPAEIVMMKKDKDNLGGYIKLQLGKLSIVRPCSAHYDREADEYSWRCESLIK